MYNSHGIITYVSVQKNTHFLLAQRRNSFSFIQLLRFSHRLTNEEIISKINLITPEEAIRLLTYPFEEIWEDLYIDKTNKTFVTERHRARQNYEKIKTQFCEHLNSPKSNFCEWGIPKGRRKYQESGIECALREWEEETNIPKKCVSLLNTYPFYYNLSYGNKDVSIESYLAKIILPFMITENKTNIRNYVSEEVGKLEWITIDKAKNLVPLSLYKMLIEINDFIENNLSN